MNTLYKLLKPTGAHQQSDQVVKTPNGVNSKPTGATPQARMRKRAPPQGGERQGELREATAT